MLRELLAVLWRGAPKLVRRGGVWLTQPRFAVTAGAVVLDDETGRVLLLRHVFRKGDAWGVPGGFLRKGEQPDEAIRRELCEETGIELGRVELVFVRTHRRPQQIEVIFRGHVNASAVKPRAENFEIRRAEWFDPAALPAELGRDQRRLIERVLAAAAAG